jgi:hypothetical protein
MSDLSRALLQAGLIQFGWYVPDDRPYRLHLHMLPSYPMILRQAAEAGADAVQGADRLLATADSVPLGVALSLVTGVPLVYSQGTGAAAVHDLVGAYDIGHPALLVTNQISAENHIADLVAGARHVGLMVDRTLALVMCSMPPISETLSVSGLVHLPEVVQRLAEQGELPPLHAQAVLGWLHASQQPR